MTARQSEMRAMSRGFTPRTWRAALREAGVSRQLWRWYLLRPGKRFRARIDVRVLAALSADPVALAAKLAERAKRLNAKRRMK